MKKEELLVLITENRTVNGEQAGATGNNMRVSLQGIDAQGQTLGDIEMQCCDLEGANFVGTKCDGANITDARLKLAKARNMTALGTNFSAARLVSTGAFSAANGYGGDHQEADFSGGKMAGSIWTGSNLTDALFVGADLSNAVFTNCNLSGTNFTGATLSGANFTGATLTTGSGGTNFDRALLRGAIIANTTEPAFLDAVGVVHA